MLGGAAPWPHLYWLSMGAIALLNLLHVVSTHLFAEFGDAQAVPRGHLRGQWSAFYILRTQ